MRTFRIRLLNLLFVPAALLCSYSLSQQLRSPGLSSVPGNKKNVQKAFYSLSLHSDLNKSVLTDDLSPPTEVLQFEQLQRFQASLPTVAPTILPPTRHLEADVLIQAGHQGRKQGRTGAARRYNNVWFREIDWTPVVADWAAIRLQKAGVKVIRRPALIGIFEKYKVKTAVFLHFDGSSPPGNTGASVGYPPRSMVSKSTGHRWKHYYQKYFGFSWEKDNFTKNLSGYYGYGSVTALQGKVLLEFGDITNKRQAFWMKPRLKWMGDVVAHHISRVVGKGNIPDPGPWRAR